MKKILVISIFLLTCILPSQAQTVGGIKISEIPAEYIELVGSSKLLKPLKVTLRVDYGQFGTYKEMMSSGGLLNDDGSLFSVNGMMGAVNLFAANGWELHSTMLLTVGTSNVYHYIMKKKE